MSVTKTVFTAPSCDGIHTLAGVVFCPAEKKRGYFQVIHGMAEHIGRYERFMRDMAEAGWVCFGYDHVGHGGTAKKEGERGYIADKGGWDLLARDVKAFAEAVFAAYADAVETDAAGERLPYCLMGHSMGSFVVRLATERYIKPDRLVVMGTGGANPAAGAGLLLLRAIRLFRGGKHVSPLADKLIFGGYNKRFSEVSDKDPSPWLTTDKAVREAYYADPLCGFKFTVSALSDLVRLLKYTNGRGWYKRMPEDVPVLLVAGECDPVGNYGKGVRQVWDRLRKRGIQAECILYPNARHEILNDFTYEQVKADIRAFCE